MSGKVVKICWMYPRLMNTYGDRGNVIVLSKRLEWRGIEFEVAEYEAGGNLSKISGCDLIFMGGAQDIQQKIVAKDLKNKSGDLLKNLIEDGVPGLYVCGGYQFLGESYTTADGVKIEGLNVFPIKTENSNSSRLIGNVIVKPNLDSLSDEFVVGFENHGGRTFLSGDAVPFAKVVRGSGNNGKDEGEGVIYKNSIGTYLHGPILAKSPELADWMILEAVKRKDLKVKNLKKLDDKFAKMARDMVAKNMY